MDDRAFLTPAQLSVTIEGAEFAKEFNYFITVQLEGQSDKKRTDISSRVTNPVFSSNTFHLPLPSSKLELSMRLNFAAFVVADREESVQKGKGQSRLLGEATLELGPLANSLLDTQGAGTRQHLKFTRSHEGQTVTVGRFLVHLKLLVEHQAPATAEVVDKLFHPLPVADVFSEFLWRARIDFRAAIDIPLNYVSNSGLPSSYMETGWSQYVQQMPSDQDLARTHVVTSNRHPIWNQQLLFNNPGHLTGLEGFLWLIMKDKNVSTFWESLAVPLNSVKSFHPVHIALQGANGDESSGQKAQIFLSFTIEESVTSSFVDHLVDIAIMGLNWDPVPMAISKMMVAMTTQNHHLTEIPFIRVALENEGAGAREINQHKSERHSVFLSPILSITPIRVDNPYGAQAIFTVPRSYLEQALSFYLIVRDDSKMGDHPLPNSIVGYTEVLDDDLQNSLYARENKALYVPVIWDPRNPMSRTVGQSKCTLQIAAHSLEKLEDNSLSKTKIEERPPRGEPVMSLKGSIGRDLNNSLGNSVGGEVRERWDLLSRELQQKQELIHRLMKENDEKSDALKLTGSEIIELRRQIKLLQSENALLKQRLNEEAEIDIQSVVSQEVERMNNEELKIKIIKLAHMYRTERQRNEEFEKVIKQTQDDLSEAHKSKIELDRIREKHMKDLQKFHKIQSQVDRIQTYRETIKKQETVIAKLEKILEKNLKDARETRQAAQTIEKLKTENLQLQKQIKDSVYAEGGSGSSLALDQARGEIQRLEQLVKDLREQARNKRPESEGMDDDELLQEKIRLEVMLHKAEVRVQSMQDEMEASAVKYAQEIAHYKTLLMEKQSIIDTMAVIPDNEY